MFGAAYAGPDVPESARAGAAPASPGREPRAHLSLLLDPVQARPGDRVRVGVLFELEPGWHVYWRHSGESGLPTELVWLLDGAPLEAAAATEGAGSAEPRLGPLRWPAPAVFRESDGFITTYGYGDEVLLGADLELPEGIRGEHVVGVQADFLVCEVQCIPGRAELSRALPVGDERVPAGRETRALFERHDARVPVPPQQAGVRLEAVYSQSAVRPGDAFRAAIAITACEREGSDTCERYVPGVRRSADAFVPDAIEGVELKTTGSRPHPYVEGGLLITLEGSASPDGIAESARLRGVLSVEGPRGPAYVDVDLDLPRAAAGAEVTQLGDALTWLEPLPEAPTPGLGSLGWALLYAFLGGVILNLMPCVFPVLAIKLFALTELAHAGRPRAIGGGLAYTAGILASMLALAALVIGLRSAGVAVGWGFQFQEPLFVLAVGAVLVVFALNLFGVFEIAPDLTAVHRMGEHATGHARSFFEGLLAVVLATPCSAPFLGTAVGFAFASPPTAILALFVAIGAGLAAPYVLVTCVPSGAGLFPRPGPWMLHLRSALGFALLATVIWLAWILGRSVGIDGAVAALALWLALAIGTWAFGVAQAAGRRTLGRALGVASLAGVLLAATALPFAPPATSDASSAPASAFAALDVQPFDPQGVQASLAAGSPVFVYFTADWCLTCKVNERLVFGDGDVQDELRSLGFDVFVGDWTRRDETIRRELARFGRAAVPLYLVYDPRQPDAPDLLPEVLTVDIVVQALRRAAAAPLQRAADSSKGERT